jgi:hypothetical protein
MTVFFALSPEFPPYASAKVELLIRISNDCATVIVLPSTPTPDTVIIAEQRFPVLFAKLGVSNDPDFKLVPISQ